MTHVDEIAGLAAETRYVFNMAQGLASANTAEERSEYEEALHMVADLTERPAVRVMAKRLLNRATQPASGPPAVIRPIVRRTRPLLPVFIAVAASACAWAATPSEVDPPAAETAVAYDLPVYCAEGVDHCE